MAYTALARTWRPKNFAELVGQEHVRRALVNALESGRVHHAFLFTGTRGVGKTTIARIFAKCLNCETGVTSNPCGVCGACRDIDGGRFVDLIEVDAASRTKVDDTRELLDNVPYAPTRGRYKVYLIDEVHMLSTHSFNALLKTLEEPPPHMKFLLATTDPQKLPVTVLSRCLQFNLKRLPIAQITERMREILQKEGIEFEPAGLRLIAQAADGSMRDGLSLLDQLIAFGGGKASEAEARAMLGSIARDHVVRLAELLGEMNVPELLSCARSLEEFAPDYAQVLDELASLFVHIAMKQAVSDFDGDELYAPEVLERLAQTIAPEDVQLFYQTAITGRRDLALAPDPRSGFEMTLLRMIAFRPLGEAEQPRSASGGSGSGGGPSVVGGGATAARAAVAGNAYRGAASRGAASGSGVGAGSSNAAADAGVRASGPSAAAPADAGARGSGLSGAAPADAGARASGLSGAASADAGAQASGLSGAAPVGAGPRASRLSAAAADAGPRTSGLSGAAADASPRTSGLSGAAADAGPRASGLSGAASADAGAQGSGLSGAAAARAAAAGQSRGGAGSASSWKSTASAPSSATAVSSRSSPSAGTTPNSPANQLSDTHVPAAAASGRARDSVGTNPDVGIGSQHLSATSPPPGRTGAASADSKGDVPWVELLTHLELNGAARQLATNCVLVARQGSVVRLALDVRNKHMRTPALEEKLAQALSRYFGQPTRLEFETAAAELETPAQARRAAEMEDREAARRAFEADPGVQGLRERFGATVLPDTVRPVK